MQSVIEKQQRAEARHGEGRGNLVVCTSDVASWLGVHPSALYSYLYKAGFVENGELGPKARGTGLAVFKPSGRLILWTAEGCKAIAESIMADLALREHSNACMRMFRSQAPVKRDQLKALASWEHDIGRKLAERLKRSAA